MSKFHLRRFKRDETAVILPGVVVLIDEARRRDAAGWGDALYRAARSASKTVALVAVPYYARANRAPGEMLVWIREGG